MKDNFYFASKYEYDVEVYGDDHGVIGQGELSFGDGTLIRIQFDLTQYYEAPQREFSTLKAKTKNGQKLTLFNCEFEGHSLYADFVVLGEIKSEITYFHIKYGDISDWFLRGQYITGQIGENISWKNQIPQLSVNVNTASENFSLKTDTIGSLTKRGEDHIIHEHTRFIFERKDGEFSVNEVKEKSFELSTLLSVLTANAISIANVWVGCGASYAMPIYFSAFRKVEREFLRSEFWLSCLAQRHSLDDKWQSVFDRYYASNYRKTSWVRLAGMQRYEGFWEFKTLGYVSLLDEYVSSYAAMSNQTATKAESKRVTRFVDQLKSLKHPLNDAQFKDIESLVEKVFLMSRDLTFREKYDYAVGLTDKDILKVINLTNDDFSLIKRIRDKIAHGDTPDLADTSYQEIHFIVEKIALLMTYWAYVDLGLSPSEFSTALMRTHNYLRFNPKLDKIHLERITNSAQFILVSEELFLKFVSGDASVINACFTQDLNGEIKYSEEYKAMYEAWIKDRSRTSNKIIDAFGVSPERISAVGSLYLEYGDEVKQLHGAYIIRDI